MAGEDEYVLKVAHRALQLGPTNATEAIAYRQDILRDALDQPELVRQCYALAVEAIEGKRKAYWGFTGNFPSSILYGATSVLRVFIGVLTKLRAIADEQKGRVASQGLRAFFAMLQAQFDDDYLARIRTYLADLKLDKGVLLSAQLGPGNAGVQHTLREAAYSGPGWLERLLGRGTAGHTFRIADRDLAGAQALAEIRNRGINEVANTLAQSMDHILGFFESLQAELAFYVGCVNLHAKLMDLGVPVCFPQPHPVGSRRLQCQGLRDAALALSLARDPVGNMLDADGKRLTVITGANQGGKSSFLRSLGLAQLMMQSGMFVTAERFAGELCTGVFTHYKREEDASMRSGKFDEELQRLSAMVGHFRPDAMVLFNESFASTNELEGSEIARQTVEALLDRRLKVFFVTHLYTFAHEQYRRAAEDALFLRAERLADGRRTFHIVPGEPLETGFGADLYQEVFGHADQHAMPPPSDTAAASL
jgi:hypothetical protein